MNTGLINRDIATNDRRPINVTALAIDPANPSRVFAGTTNDVFFSH